MVPTIPFEVLVMEELFDFARPKSHSLAVFLSSDNRTLRLFRSRWIIFFECKYARPFVMSEANLVIWDGVNRVVDFNAAYNDWPSSLRTMANSPGRQQAARTSTMF